MSPQRLQYNYYVQVLMPFYAGKLLLLRDLNCAHAMFLVSNTPGNSYLSSPCTALSLSSLDASQLQR